MVPIFGLDVQDKPFFPHLANRPENYGCNLFPTKSDYLADGMNIAKRKEFDKCFTTDYPIGHPTLHVPCEEVDWRTPEDNPYPLAILKVFVIPPRQIDVPVLPVKVDDRLGVPLCMKCCKKFPNGAVKLSYSCKHSDRERGWISTCTSLEV
ncbi:hypothetical protein niasHS_009964 [Heterodera schachtii]|uniref:Uncharacterized protein n=1 Tax=Heterodera schachtii TaxID=97005 RepID=A0ABD2JD19_HETSC